VNSKGRDNEGLNLRDAGDGELEGDLPIGMSKYTTVGKRDLDRRT